MQFAAVFPGQGSQSTSMLSQLAEKFDIIKQTFDEGSDLLSKDLWKITTQEDNTELNKTENTQPAMLAAGVAVWRLWLNQGGCKPVGMAGHSLGEYSALVAAGTFSFKDAISVVAKRAAYMQNAVPEGCGAMAAILGLEDAVIVKICGEISSSNDEKLRLVEAVNFNSPGQVVIAGDAESLEIAMEKMKEAGAKRAIKLAVSVPSHCSLLKDAAMQLDQDLSEVNFNEPDYPVVQNFEAKSYNSAKEKQSALSRQLYKPVKWVDTINNLHNEFSADTIIEFGPGKILFGLNRRINRDLGNICIHDLASLDNALQMCNA